MNQGPLRLHKNLSTQSGWEIIEGEFNPQDIPTTGSNFLVGNGYLGYRGTCLEWGADRYTACIVTDTYDQGQGDWPELCNVPNGLFTRLMCRGKTLSYFEGQTISSTRTLDLKRGLFSRDQTWQAHPGAPELHLETQRLASLADVHTLALRLRLETNADQPLSLTLETGIDGQVWNLQGEHFRSLSADNLPNPEGDHDLLVLQTRTLDEDIHIAVVEGMQITGPRPTEISLQKGERHILRNLVFEMRQDTPLVIEKFVKIYTSNDLGHPLDTALGRMRASLRDGYEEVKTQHCRAWDRIWAASDIEIEGHLEDQALTRFNLYHNIIATPRHAPLPIGARGLSTQVYQGAAFWDQEIFNLPMFTYTQPDVARNILTYRYHTLDGARHKARRLGYTGAFYAWTSGKTGRELFPDFFFTDVLSGRKIRNHFNDWQIHISPDIVYAVCKYVQATGDREFYYSRGAEILFAVARFLYAHAYFKPTKKRYEFIRLLGPDEYHENVDNNAFTNHQAHFALRKALHVHQEMDQKLPGQLKELQEKMGLSREEIAGWEDMLERLYLPQPDPETGLIEQFDGYFQLEDTTPQVLRQRLIVPEEYWGWPNGVAVHTQVLKQADVLQLLALHDRWPQEVLQANYDYYEPRTEHGSSLSPSVHAQVACRAGRREDAYRYFKESAAIDLYAKTRKVVSGGSFLGGIHTAACGATWEIIVRGFAGFRWQDGVLHFRPRLPGGWSALTFKLILQGHRFTVKVDQARISLTSLSGDNPIPCQVGQARHTLDPGGKLTFPFK